MSQVQLLILFLFFVLTFVRLVTCTFYITQPFSFLFQNQKPMESAEVKIDEITEIDMNGFEQVEDTDISKVNSYSTSNDGLHIILSTQSGIFIINNPLFIYKCYLNQNSPFWIANTNFIQIGVKITSLVNNRNEAAVVPNFTNKYFSQAHVYIFDYEMKCILHSIDFFLNIKDLKITESEIFVSNKKRVIIYNYLNDTQDKSQKYYLDQYVSNEPNETLRYFSTNCENYDDPLEIKQKVEVKDQPCNCGRFYISCEKPLTMAYLQNSYKQGKRKIWLYHERLGTYKDFEQNLNIDLYFEMALSKDGEYLAYTINDGRNINVYNLKENRLYCVLYASSRIRQICKMQFFKAKVEGIQQLCLGLIRKTDVSTATLHVFLIQSKPPTEAITSRFRRYFPVYENLLQLYRTSSSQINPGFFIHDNFLWIYSICGRIFKAIEFSRTGQPPQITFQPNHFHKKWQFQKNSQ